MFGTLPSEAPLIPATSYSGQADHAQWTNAVTAQCLDPVAQWDAIRNEGTLGPRFVLRASNGWSVDLLRCKAHLPARRNDCVCIAARCADLRSTLADGQTLTSSIIGAVESASAT